jgi:hypothetical protein
MCRWIALNTWCPASLAIANTVPPHLNRIPDPSTSTARQFFVKFSYPLRF